MKYYELTYLISSELSEEEAKEVQGGIISLIQAEEGILGEINSPIKKRLAYPIKKTAVYTQQYQAYLASLNFQLNPEKLASLEKKLKSENRILRYLILNKPPVKEILVRSKRKPRIFPEISKKVREVMPKKEKKVELKEIEKKLEEIINESQ